MIDKSFFIWLGHFPFLVQLLDLYESFAGKTDTQTNIVFLGSFSVASWICVNV